MISVQNHQQLLNGNRFLVVFVLFFGITSCAAKKLTTSYKKEVVELNANTNSNSSLLNTSVLQNNTDDSILIKAIPFDLDDVMVNETIKDSIKVVYADLPKVLNNDPNRIHTIAVLMPFYLDQIPLGAYVDDSTKQLTGDSRNAIEFYLGCQLARDKFNSNKQQTNVYFIDDKNDSAKIANIFTKKPFPNVDFVIGPIGYKNLKLASDLARSNQTPLISPFATSIYIKDNNYFYNANTSLRGQYLFLLEQAKAQFPTKILEIIYDGKDSSAENIKLLKDIAEKYYDYSNIKYISLRASDDIKKAMTQTDTLNQRLVLIYSSKVDYVKSVLSKLNPIKNNLQIYTSSCTKNAKGLTDVKYSHDIYTAYQYSNGSANYSVFEDKFVSKYKKNPTEIAHKAYDLMMHLFNMIDKNQTLQDNTYAFSLDNDNTQSKFQFKPVLNKNGNVDYYDNVSMYLYKYVSGNFTIINNK